VVSKFTSWVRGWGVCCLGVEARRTGVGYDLGSLGFVGSRRNWAGSLLCSEGEKFVKFFL